jgi:hypothetical protein
MSSSTTAAAAPGGGKSRFAAAARGSARVAPPSSAALTGGLPPKRKRVPSVRQGPLPAPETVSRLMDLSLPHVASFSYMCDRGLAESVADIPAREYTTRAGDT